MRIVLALLSFALAVSAYGDTANVKKGHSQLVFRQVDTSASGGSSAARPFSGSEKLLMFRALDIDGDGFVSKAEAAGNSPTTLGFDRADRNRDGKLSFNEYDSIGRPRPQKKQAQAKREGSASAGATKPKN
jgi:hypothetical protein